MIGLSITIRRADADDIAFIMSVERLPGYAALVGEWSHAQHVEKLADPDYAYFLAFCEGEPVGFAIFKDIGSIMGNLCLHRIAVARTGSGMGTMFISKLCDWAFGNTAIHRLWLDVLTDNEAALHAYRKLGFVEEGIMRSALRYPDGRRADLALMSILRTEWTAAVLLRERTIRVTPITD